MMNRSNLAAIYCRLSAEDRDKLDRNEYSQSIQNQISMLVDYATRQGWTIYNIYVDDDYQGSDRKRPGFNRLLQEAREKKFGIVLCKSQSRFTRELELVEKIIHRDFVEWGIRFVGFADNADTDNKGNKKSRQINGLVNEWYLEDLSDSIKTVLTDHRKKGLHIGAFALYGYQKDPEKKGHLIIDPEAAAIVREVFELYAAGVGKVSIARQLNARGIPNPTAYKQLKGMKFGGSQKSNSGLWKYYSITSMISNEMYIGNMVQGKYENKTYKSLTSSPVPKERWIRVEGTHEPIIEKELWDRVQKMREDRAKPMCTGELGLFAKKTRCMYCGYTLHSAKNREFRYLVCPQRKVGADCKGAFVAQRFLEQAILDDLNKIINRYFDQDSAQSHVFIKNETEERKNRIKKELQAIRSESDSLKKAIRDLYMDKAKKIITENDFLFLKSGFDEELEQKEKRELALNDKLKKIAASADKIKNKMDILEQYKNIDHLDRVIIDNLIDYIEIGRSEKKIHKNDLPPINIHWKF
ncbi:MAG: recombinase family protein [Lachnospiraceae bacterium]|nr:recombinase family protein [Lachnospiraceae bacterium]